MKILELDICNVRGIPYMTLKPEGKNLVVWGLNGSGKSAVVDAIDFLLTGHISRLIGEGTGELSLPRHGPHIDHMPEDAVVRALICLEAISEPIEIKRCMSAPQDVEIVCEEESKPFYDRIILHPSLVKPSLQLITDELVEYKAELTAEEDARLAEVARVKDIKDRFNAIGDIRGALVKANINIKNPALELKRIIEEDDQSVLSALESAATEVVADENKKNNRKNKKQLGRIAVKACEACLELIAGFNITRNLTAEQKDTMATTYAPLLEALNQKRPGKFKSLVEGLTPDGTLVTDQMKTELLEELAEFGM